MPKAQRSIAWICSCGIEMARLSVLFCTSCGKSKGGHAKNVNVIILKIVCHVTDARKKISLICERFYNLHHNYQTFK